jgi:hypothetical protein
MQQTFEVLRAQFANSIHLVHPDSNLPYSMYTDASKYAIGAVLMQTDKDGETHIISTASRVLTTLNKSIPLVNRNCCPLFTD